MRESLKFLQELRDIGVRLATLENNNVVQVEFFPAHTDTTGPALPKQLNFDGPEMCPCGHDETAHNGDGACLIGCADRACQPEVTQ